MCGICGIVRWDGGPAYEAEVRTMAADLAHRGPDDEGVWAEGPAALGHRRLSIIDLSPLGHQPMFSAGGRFVIIFNGEIYNFQDLRQRFAPDYPFRSRSDTEVLLALYERMGAAMVPHLNGMFAFAIWDRQERRLFLARDRAGKKPLFYTESPGYFAFASEIRALARAPGFRRDLHWRALDLYLAFQYVPAPWTIYRDAHKLPPAHTLELTAPGAAPRRYWRLDYHAKNDAGGETRAGEQFLQLLDAATRRRLIADVPVGAFLSGGLDSSAVVASMARGAPGAVRTFSIGFGEPAYNELAYAREVATAYRTRHTEFIVRPDSAAILPYLAWCYGEPFADSSAIPTYYVSRLSRKHVTVVLNGDGGDESFAGYDRYEFARAGHLLARLPPAVRRRVLPRLYDHLPRHRRIIWRLRAALDNAALYPERTYLDRMVIFPDGVRHGLYSAAAAAEISAQAAAAWFTTQYDAIPAGNLLDRLLGLDVETYLPGDLLVKVDIASMAVALEARSPLLDHNIMEFAAALPPEFKRRAGRGKYIMNDALEDRLPPSIRFRAKMGFGVPIAEWFRVPLRDFVHDLLLGLRATTRGIFNPEKVRALLGEHETGANHGHQIYALVMLELWFRQFMDDPAVPPPPLPDAGLFQENQTPA